jgi:hypothetical protein
LIDENSNIRFYLPFACFKTCPAFSDINQYLLYKKGVMNFIKSRNKRIENYINLKNTEHEGTHNESLRPTAFSGG